MLHLKHLQKHFECSHLHAIHIQPKDDFSANATGIQVVVEAST